MDQATSWNDFVKRGDIMSLHSDAAVRGGGSDRSLVVGPVDIDKTLEGILIVLLKATKP